MQVLQEFSAYICIRKFVPCVRRIATKVNECSILIFHVESFQAVVERLFLCQCYTIEIRIYDIVRITAEPIKYFRFCHPFPRAFLRERFGKLVHDSQRWSVHTSMSPLREILDRMMSIIIQSHGYQSVFRVYWPELDLFLLYMKPHSVVLTANVKSSACETLPLSTTTRKRRIRKFRTIISMVQMLLTVLRAHTGLPVSSLGISPLAAVKVMELERPCFVSSSPYLSFVGLDSPQPVNYCVADFPGHFQSFKRLFQVRLWLIARVSDVHAIRS